MSKVVHLSNDAHAAAKAYCKENGLKMSDWVASLITKAIIGEREPEPVQEPVAVAEPQVVSQVPDVVSSHQEGPKKKKLARLDEEVTDDGGTPAYARPPFWARSEEPKVEKSSTAGESEEPSVDLKGQSSVDAQLDMATPVEESASSFFSFTDEPPSKF